MPPRVTREARAGRAAGSVWNSLPSTLPTPSQVMEPSARRNARLITTPRVPASAWWDRCTSNNTDTCACGPSAPTAARAAAALTSKSSIRRLAPGSPRPSPPEVEYPSCSARVTSGIPGPWSRPTTTTPRRSPFVTTLRMISPRFAYMRMFRAISEMAAAMTVLSPLEKPAAPARSRPSWRAVTTSTSAAIGIRCSSATHDASLHPLDAQLRLPIQEGEALLEVERGRDALERQPELDHRECDLGLDPDDNRFGAAQAGHVRDVAQRAHGERVHHVERRHVDDHATGPELSHALNQRLAQLREIGVGQRRLDRRDQVVALLEDRNFHGALRLPSRVQAHVFGASSSSGSTL